MYSPLQGEVLASAKKVHVEAVSGPESSGPKTGLRPNRASRQRMVASGEKAAEACAELAVAVAQDLSTYWSNSVRAYALLRSPFLRPPVYASLWRFSFTMDLGDESAAAPAESHTIEARAALKGVHERELLELEIEGGVDAREAGPRLSGSAWCVATKPEKGFEIVCVPPLPMSQEQSDAAVHRVRAIKQRPKKLFVVKERRAEASLYAQPTNLTLHVKADDADGDEIARVYNRDALKIKEEEELSPSACGDVGPLVAAAMRTAMGLLQDHGATVAPRVVAVEVEAAPMKPEEKVLLCARVESELGADGTVRAALVTGWVHGHSDPALRFRLEIQA